MKRSDSINELAAALAKAQAAFETATRDHTAKVETRTGGSYTFAYADFAAYLSACRVPLSDAGLSFVQEGKCDGSNATATTLLMHSSGQWIETDPLSVPLIPDSRGAITAQIIGSGITYAKRYSLSSLLGLASEADDDGNTASGNDAEIAKRKPKPPCPKCGKTACVIVGKPEYGGGLVCFKKAKPEAGCGHTWATEDFPAATQEPSKTEPPKAEPPKQPEPCKDYDHLANVLRNLGAKNADQANSLLAVACPDQGYTVAALKTQADICRQIVEAINAAIVSGDVTADKFRELAGITLDKPDAAA